MAMSIITFSSGTRVVLPLTIMNTEGKNKALAAINGIRLGGCTELWDGIKAGFQAVDDTSIVGEEASKHVWLLTDGCPTDHPSIGHIGMVKSYNSRHASDRILRTFGYGTSIDAQLLSDLAGECSGSFAYIPGAGFIGTVASHAWANMLFPTAAPEETVQLKKRERFISVLKSITDYVRPREASPYAAASGSWHNGNRKIKKEELEVIRNMYKKYREENPEGSHEEQIEIAMESLDFWNTWGFSYCLSLLNAHHLAECNNFKDPSVQIYSRGDDWKKCLNHIHDLYCDMPAPTPSITRYSSRSSGVMRGGGTTRGGGSVSPPPLTTMRAYSQSTGPCFSESARIRTSTGKDVMCQDITRGTRVESCNTHWDEHRKCWMLTRGVDTIECIVKTWVKDTTLYQVTSGARKQNPYAKDPEYALIVTGWHPVAYSSSGDLCSEDTWKFPIDICTKKIEASPKGQWVYSFVLKKRGTGILIENMWGISLGHRVKLGIAEHPFWGTEKVVDCLKQLPPTFVQGAEKWSYSLNGVVRLGMDSTVRDPESGLVKEIISSMLLKTDGYESMPELDLDSDSDSIEESFGAVAVNWLSEAFPSNNAKPVVGEYGYFDSRLSPEEGPWLITTEDGGKKRIGCHYSLPYSDCDHESFVTCYGIITSVAR